MYRNAHCATPCICLYLCISASIPASCIDATSGARKWTRALPSLRSPMQSGRSWCATISPSAPPWSVADKCVAYRIVSYHAVLCYVLLCAALQFFIVLYSAVLCYILVDLCYISLCSVLCALLVVLCSTDEVCWDGLYRIYFSLSLTFTSPLLIIY